jgi:hypothetical protein
MKCVDCYTHWGKHARMCQHCNLCLSAGIETGDGALLIHDGQAWRHLHGEANPAPAGKPATPSAPQTKQAFQPRFHHRLKTLGRRAIRKCVYLASRLFPKSA